MRRRGDVARADMAAHRDAAETERQSRRQRRQRRIGARAAGRRVGDDADLMAARRLRRARDRARGGTGRRPARAGHAGY